jgi:hypothetical protein
MLAGGGDSLLSRRGGAVERDRFSLEVSAGNQGHVRASDPVPGRVLYR